VITKNTQIVAAVVAFLIAATVVTKVARADEEALQEVIVTAERRSENLQQVPMSITAIDSTQLEQRNIVSFIDYGTTVPNLAFGYSGVGYANGRTISIRGVAGANTTGFYLDDTPLPDTIDPRIVDIDRIEVLRGPQGTLYGARSEGGTVRLITRQPDVDDFSGRVHAGVSDTWNTVEPNYYGDGAINIPLIKDRLALRIVGLYDSEAGFFRREFPTDPPFGTTLQTVKNVADSEVSGTSISLAWKASDELTITPRFMYQQNIYNGFPYSDHTNYEVPAPTVAPTNLDLDPNNFVQKRLYDVKEGGHDRWTLESLTANYHTDYGDFVWSTSYFARDLLETEDASDYNYQIFEAPFETPITQGTRVHQFVQELRFASHLQGALQYVVGLYYESSTGEPAYDPPAIAPGLNTYFGGTPTMPAEGLNPLNPDEVTAYYDHTHETEPAAYGELYYQATQKLKLVAGARVYQNKNTSSSWQEGIVDGGPRITDPPETVTQSGVNPKAEIDYQATPDKMVYASASKGFRPGGISPSVPLAFGCGDSLASLGVTVEEARRYQSDSLWSYEVGEKSSWLDQRLTLNASAFYIDWSNLQQNILLSCGFGYVGNVGAAKSEGFELEGRTKPFASLDLSGGVGYQHAVITDANVTSPQKPGDPIYQVPDWTANIAVTHTLPLTQGLNLVSNLTYGYVGHSYSANNNPFVPRIRPAYGLLDSRFAFEFSKYEVALFGKNLQNTHANLSDSASIAAEVVGRPRIVTNQPRTIGIDFVARF
jgi:iron complex outermembrane recepter protein